MDNSSTESQFDDLDEEMRGEEENPYEDNVYALVKKGYFPKEVIPPFNTDALANILDDLDFFIMDSRTDKTSTKCCLYSMPKSRNFRRTLAIPNPINQIKLSKSIIDGWDELEEHYKKSKISLTTPVRNITSSDRFFLPGNDFSSIQIERVRRSTSSRYMLYTDISRYYSTIYTHSIPWALHSKARAKREKNNMGLLGNRLDKYVRNTQDLQTFGIPTGPDTSLIISEIIGAVVDGELNNRIKKLKGFRYIDDYYLFFSTMSEAELTLSALHSVLREYELELNNNKLFISHLPEPLDTIWVSSLRMFRFTQRGKGQSINLIDYFSKSFEYAKAFPYEHVMKYAISRIKSLKVKEDNWDLYEALLLKSLMYDQSILPLVTEIFITYYELGYPLNKKRISETLLEVIMYNTECNNSYELAWALWLCLSLGIKLPAKVSKNISSISNNLVALTALHMREKGLINKGLDLDEWKSKMNKEELTGENWLLSYEAKLKGWIRTSENYISRDVFFKVLQDKSVEFYSDSRQIKKIELRDLDRLLERRISIQQDEWEDYYEHDYEDLSYW